MSGLWFEEFEVGHVCEHQWTRTITQTDNHWFSLMTMNPQPVHIDAHAAAKSVWGKPLVNSLFTLDYMVGMTVNDTTFGTTVANLGMEAVKFPHPLFEGDKIRLATTVLDERASKSRPGVAIVPLRCDGYDQDDVLSGTCELAAVMRMRPADV